MWWLAASGIALAVYLWLIRPWQLRWGATDEEVLRAAPGDDLVPAPTFNATRAVTISAPPAEIWPWIAQIGFDRAGWYSYDLIDNLGRPSSREILPQFQNRQPGDLVPIFKEMGLWVHSLQQPNWILWTSRDGHTTWFWGIYPVSETETRLITRVRIRYRWTSPTILFNLLLDVGDIIMMRKCMLGIKERAESLRRQAA